MPEVEAEVEEVDLENEHGRMVPGVRATCSCPGKLSLLRNRHTGELVHGLYLVLSSNLEGIRLELQVPAEGLVKQLGCEAKSLGVTHRAAAARGGSSAQRSLGRGLTSAGESAQRHAGKVGKGVELGTMAALPLPTGVGTVGGALGGAVPGLSAAGDYAAHLAEKGLGTIGLKGAGRAAARATPAVAKKLAPAFVGAA